MDRVEDVVDLVILCRNVYQVLVSLHGFINSEVHYILVNHVIGVESVYAINMVIIVNDIYD